MTALDNTGPGKDGQSDSSKKTAMIAALHESHGIVTRAIQIACIARSTHYEWLNTDPDYKEAVEAANEASIDFVESKLFEKINGVQIRTGVNKDGEDVIYDQPPSDTALIFFLKCRAKKRGYVERTEIEHSGDLSVTWNEIKNYESKGE